MTGKALGIICASYNDTAFKQLTESRSVATLPFGGRYRLIDFPLSNMVNSGIGTVGLIAPRLYVSLMDHVGDGKPWGLSKKEGGLFILPGTVYGERNMHSKFLLRDFIRNRKILDKEKADYVIVCDAGKVMTIDFSDFLDSHIKSGCPISFLYKEVRSKRPGTYLKIKKNGQLAQFRQPGEDSKKLFLDCFIIDRKYFLDFIRWYDSFDHQDIIDIIRDRLRTFKINTFEFKDYCGVIDSIDDYRAVSMDLLHAPVRKSLFESDMPIITKPQDEAPTIYRKSAKVSSSLVASGCVIEGVVENSIIFRDARIAKGAVVRNSIVMQHFTIEEGAVVDNVICDKYVTITKGSILTGGKNGPSIVGRDKEV